MKCTSRGHNSGLRIRVRLVWTLVWSECGGTKSTIVRLIPKRTCVLSGSAYALLAVQADGSLQKKKIGSHHTDNRSGFGRSVYNWNVAGHWPGSRNGTFFTVLYSPRLYVSLLTRRDPLQSTPCLPDATRINNLRLPKLVSVLVRFEFSPLPDEQIACSCLG